MPRTIQYQSFRNKWVTIAGREVSSLCISAAKWIIRYQNNCSIFLMRFFKTERRLQRLILRFSYASTSSASAYQLQTLIDAYFFSRTFYFQRFQTHMNESREREPQVHMIYFSPKIVKMIDGEHCAMRGNLLTRNIYVKWAQSVNSTNSFFVIFIVLHCVRAASTNNRKTSTKRKKTLKDAAASFTPIS